MDYDETLEFKELLRNYEKSKSEGKVVYFDSDDFVDIAEHYLRNDLINETLQAIEDGLAIHHNEPNLISMKVNALISLHEFDEAERLLPMVNPSEDHDCYYFQAQIACGKRHDLKSAEQNFVKWLEIETAECDRMKDREEAELRLREAYMHIILSISDLISGPDVPQAIEQWTRRYIKKCSPLAGDDIDVDIARVCHEEGLLNLEIELYNLILDSNPYMPQGYTYLASLQMMLGDEENAINSAEFALAINPEDVQALVVKAQGYYTIEDFHTAEAAFRKLIDISGDEYYLAMHAHCLVRIGKMEEGIALLHEATEYAKDIADKDAKATMRAYLADVYMRAGLITEAKTLIGYAILHDPLSVDFYYEKGMILLADSNYKSDEVRKAFSNAVVNAQEDIRMLFQISAELMNRNLFADALYFLEWTLRISDAESEGKTYIYITHCLYQMGSDMYKTYLKKACELTPEYVRKVWGDYLQGCDKADYFETLMNTLFKP